MANLVTQSILIRAPNWIGDQVLAYPFFHALRQAFPNARIVAACVPWVAPVQFRNLVDEVHELPRPREQSLTAKIGVLYREGKELRRKGPWDLAVTLPNSISSAWLIYLAGARTRRGFAMEGRGIFLNERLSWKAASHSHRAQAYLDVLPESAKPKGWQAMDFWGVPARDDDEETRPGVLNSFDAAAAWPDAQPLEPPSEPYWCLAPGTQADSRRWPIAYYVKLARQIFEATGLRGLVVGGAGEAPAAASLCEDRATGLRDWTARGQVTSYWQVFRSARFTIANDSGLAHLASLCGSPVHIPWGAGDPKKTKPIGPGRVGALLNPVACWPCGRNSCGLSGDEKYACLRGIEPETVWKEVAAWIQ